MTNEPTITAWTNRQVEKGLVGTMLHRSENVSAFLGRFSEWGGVLTLTEAKNVTQAIVRLYSRGVEWQSDSDGVNFVTAELIQLGIKDSATLDFVDDAADSAPTGLNFPYWAGIAGDIQERRQRQSNLDDLQKRSHEMTREEFQAALDKLEPPETNQAEETVKEVRDIVQDVIDQAQDRYDGKLPEGLNTGIRSLDNKLGGLIPTQLMILAARPSAGKTSLALDISRHIAGKGHKVGIVSLEMDRRVLTQWLVCQAGKLNREVLRDATFSDQDFAKMTAGNKAVSKLPIVIDDRAGLQLEKVKGQMRDLVNKYSAEILVVDFLQRISTKDQDRYHETTEIAKQLKEMARALNVPVIALTQLNRAIEKEKRVPLLSDLRDSGAIEENADSVVFLHKDKDANEEQDPIRMNLHVAKNRTGKLGIVELWSHRSTGRFEETE